MADWSYHDWIRYNAKRYPEKVALAEVESGRAFSYAAFDARIDALASHLHRTHGVGIGSRVGVLSKSCTEAFEIQFACARLGAIFAPFNWRLTTNELEYLIGNADPTVLLYEREFADKSRRLAEDKPTLHLLELAQGEPGSEYEEAIASCRGVRPPAVSVDSESTWMLLYTSGTTGRPKGAMLSYRMMLYNVLNFTGPSRLASDSVFLCAMPTFHTGGLSCYANPVFHNGGTVLVMREFDPAEALRLMSAPVNEVTHFFGTAAHYLMISQASGFGQARFPGVRLAGLGGAPFTDHLLRVWLDKKVTFQPAYGMTEIGPAVLITEEGRVREKLGSSGQPVMHAEIKIADPEGRRVPQGEKGEMWVRGPIVMSGYWQRPEATEEAFTDGWFRTGDIAWRDEDDYFYIVDRLKDMFISGGENVYPVEVENVICEADGVSTAAVVGMPDEKWGEVGRAFVVPARGRQLSPDELRAHCLERLAKYKVPRQFVIVEDLPRTASGKVLKRELREWRG